MAQCKSRQHELAKTTTLQATVELKQQQWTDADQDVELHTNTQAEIHIFILNDQEAFQKEEKEYQEEPEVP